jgi:ubiquinone/menaquinone biosynthesis C-methylase UbiE
MRKSNQSVRSDNLHTYNQPHVASYYALLNYLTPCERSLFDLWIKPGSSVLDLGVGGGRTTPHLSRLASRYVGVDYASEMIGMCRKKYPDLEFIEAEASNLSALESSSFDAIVIAFNGLDYVIPAENRALCCRECYRLLKPEGVLIFSSHNPRSIWVRPSWNRNRIHTLARNFAGNSIAAKPVALALNLAAGARAYIRSIWRSVKRIVVRVPTRTFWRGEGYMQDSAHGGLATHCWVPARVAAELQQRGFRIERVLGDDFPYASGEYITDWYYYVFSKSNSAENGETCALK